MGLFDTPLLCAALGRIGRAAFLTWKLCIGALAIVLAGLLSCTDFLEQRLFFTVALPVDGDLMRHATTF